VVWRLSWRIQETESWLKLGELKRVMRVNAMRIYESNYEVLTTISKEQIKEYIAKYWNESACERIYIAKIVNLRGTSGKYMYDREWLSGYVDAHTFEIGDVIETGWTVREKNRILGIRHYYAVLLGDKKENEFVKFARRQTDQSKYVKRRG
jgi:hypothetical protein